MELGIAIHELFITQYFTTQYVLAIILVDIQPPQHREQIFTCNHKIQKATFVVEHLVCANKTEVISVQLTLANWTRHTTCASLHDYILDVWM